MEAPSVTSKKFTRECHQRSDWRFKHMEPAKPNTSTSRFTKKKSFLVARDFVVMTKTLITKQFKELNQMYAECSADDPAEEYAEKIRLAVSQLLEEESMSIISDLVNHISIYKLIDYFVDVKYDNQSWLDFILHSIMSNSKILRGYKIVENELMGAAFIFKGSRTPNPLLFARASYCEGRRGLQYWRVALRLLSSQAAADIPTIPKKIRFKISQG